MISSSTTKLKKKLFWTNKKLFNFSTPQDVKDSWTKLENKLVKTSDEFVKISGFRIRPTLINFRVAIGDIVQCFFSENECCYIR